MSNLENGKERVKQICDLLKKETLEPAKKEAQDIVTAAKKEAEQILALAKENADKIAFSAKEEMERQRSVFSASLKQAGLQAIETLKEKLTENFFSNEFAALIKEPLKTPQTAARIIDVLVKGIEEKGIDSDLSIFVSSNLDVREINKQLSSSVLSRLQNQSVSLGAQSGVRVRIVKENVTLELTDASIKDLIGNYLREDFYDLIFKK